MLQKGQTATVPQVAFVEKPRYARVFITGIHGFIGSHLANTLAKEGWEVKGIDNFSHSCGNPLEGDIGTYYGDVRYYNDIAPYVEWADVTVHTAAQIHVDKSITNPQETIDINVSGTLNILEACKKFQKKMVYASTSEVYGTSQKEYMDENHPVDAQSPYGASKLAGERLCYSYFSTYGLDVSILRNFNTFGSYQGSDSYGGVIAIFTKAALEGEPLKIFGDGTQERDYMWIDDAVQGYKLCIQNNLQGKPINVGTGKTVTINKLAESIKKLTGSKSEIVHTAPRPGEVQRLCAGVKRAESLGFTPSTDFEKHLEQYIEGEKKNLKAGNYGKETSTLPHHRVWGGWESTI